MINSPLPPHGLKGFKNKTMDNNNDLKQKISIAIVNKDYEGLKVLKDKLAKQRWLSQFNGNVPVAEWLKPNPFVKFED